MKSICCVLAIACLSLTSLAGCTDNAPKSDTSDVVAPAQTTVIRYTTDDIKALPAGEFLQVDLNDADTVYSIKYDDVSELDSVLVTRGLDQYILGERVPASTSASASKHIILAASDSAGVANAGEVDPNIEVSCRCPCCIQVGDWIVCCF